MSALLFWALLLAIVLFPHIADYIQRKRYTHVDLSYAHRFTITSETAEVTTSMKHAELAEFSPKLMRVKLPGLGWKLVRLVQTDVDMAVTWRYVFRFDKALVKMPADSMWTR